MSNNMYPVFTMGSGRCGTNAMALLMARAGFHSLHEGIEFGGGRADVLPMFSAHPEAQEYNDAAWLTRFVRHRSCTLKGHQKRRLHEAAPQFHLAIKEFNNLVGELSSTPILYPRVIHLVRDPVETVSSFVTKFPGVYNKGRPPQWSDTRVVGGWNDTMLPYQGNTAEDCWAQHYEHSNREIESVMCPRWVFKTEWISDLDKVNDLLDWVGAPKKLTECELPPYGTNGRTREQIQRGKLGIEHAEAAVEKYVRWKP